MSKIINKWKKLVSVMMAVWMGFMVVPNALGSTMAAETATPGDTSQTAKVMIEAKFSEKSEKMKENMANIVYEVFEDQKCKDLAGSFVLSCDGKAYTLDQNPVVYNSRKKIDKKNLAYLELPAGKYYYRMADTLYKSEKRPGDQNISYDDQVYPFSVTGKNRDKQNAFVLKPEINVIEMAATPTDAHDMSEEKIFLEKPVSILTQMLQTAFYSETGEDFGQNVEPVHNWYYDNWMHEMTTGIYADEFDREYESCGHYYACAQWVWDHYIASKTVSEAACLKPTNNNTESTSAIRTALDNDIDHWEKIKEITITDTSYSDEAKKEAAVKQLFADIRTGSVQAGDIIIFKRKGETNHIGILSASHRAVDRSLGIWQSNGSTYEPSKTGLGKLYWTATLDGDSSGADGFLIYRKKRENEAAVSIKKTLDGKMNVNTEGVVFKLYKVKDKNSELDSAGSVKIAEFTVDRNGIGIPTLITKSAIDIGAEIDTMHHSIIKLPYGTYLMEESATLSDGKTLSSKNMTKADHQYCVLDKNNKTYSFSFDNATTRHSSIYIRKTAGQAYNTLPLDEYNMAGITYKFFETADTKGNRVNSLAAVGDEKKYTSVNEIVLSYNGKAYMDTDGKNIIFTSKKAKTRYGGDIKEFKFFVDDKYCSKKIYVKEAASIKGVDADSKKYYYYNENGNNAYENAGKNLTTSGFQLDSNWHSIAIPSQNNPQNKIFHAEDVPMLGKVRVSKIMSNGGDVEKANGVIIWLERKNEDGEWEHVGTYSINKKGYGIPVNVPKAGENIGIRTNYNSETEDVQTSDKRNLLSVPFGVYRLIEYDTKGLDIVYPESGYYRFTISEKNFDNTGKFLNNLSMDAGYKKAAGTDESMFEFKNGYPVKVRLSKKSSNPNATDNVNIYNMAGIQYRIYDSNKKAASALSIMSAGVKVVPSNRIFLSYNGKAYMDGNGRNVVFVSEESRKDFEKHGGEVHLYVWATDQVDETFYYREYSELLKDESSKTGAYYYHIYNKNDSNYVKTESMIDVHNGSDISVTGFEQDTEYHEVKFGNKQVLDILEEDTYSCWGKFELNKVSNPSVKLDSNMYNMAGIRYGIYDGNTSKAKRITASKHIRDDGIIVQPSDTIVLSYDGNAYMDENGKNIVFVSAEAKNDYKQQHNDKVYTYRWYKHGLTENTTYYYHEFGSTLDKETEGAAYYYDDNSQKTRNLITAHSGKAIAAATGFVHDSVYHAFQFEFGTTGNVSRVSSEVEETTSNQPVFWGKFLLQKDPAVPVINDRYYNMAGIQYRIYDEDGKKTEAKAVTASEHTTADNIVVQPSHTIVLSYDGHPYMDEQGRNIVFVRAEAKDDYKKSHDVYYYRWYKHGLTEPVTYYYHELAYTLDRTGSNTAYYYEDGTDETKNLINRLGGTASDAKAINVTGYKHDPSYHSFIIALNTDGTGDVIEKTTTDDIRTVKAKATKKYSGATEELKGVKFYLYKVSGNGIAYNKKQDLVATYIHNGTNIVVQEININNKIGFYAQKGTGNEAAYIKELPFGWYCLVEDSVTAQERGFSVAEPVYLEADKDHTTLNFQMSDIRSGLRLKKKYADTDIGNFSNYSLAGAEYQAYLTSGNGVESTNSYICTFKTDEKGEGYISKYAGNKYYALSDIRNGHAYKIVGIPLDSWIYVKETKKSAGCEFDSKSYFLHFTADNMEQCVTSVEPIKSSPFNIQLQKKDSTSGSVSGIGSFEGAQFTIRYYDVPVTGTDAVTTYEQLKGKSPVRTWVYETDPDGRIDTGDTDKYLVTSMSDELFVDSENKFVIPLGVITIEETKAPAGYTLKGGFFKDGKTRERVSNDEGIVCVVIKDSNSLASYVVENSIIREEVALRSDLKFKKIALDTKEPLSGIAFQISSKTTGESHIVITDDNGMIDTSRILHSENTNAADIDNKTIGGTWFYGNKDGKGTIDNTLGALPFDVYEIAELVTDVNKDYRLLTPITVDLTDSGMYTDGYQLYDLGTVTNVPEPSIGTRALGVDTEDNIVPANTKVNVKDICDYRYFESGKTYTIKGIIMDPETKKPFIQKDGSYSLGHKTFTVASDPTGYKCDKEEIPYIIDTTGIEGKDVVVAEYVYEGEDDSDLVVNPDGTIDKTGVLTTHTGKLVVHDDLTIKTQTLSVPKIGTTALGVETETHYLLNSGIIKFKDIVSYTNVIPGKTYDLSAVVMDKDTGKPLLDVDGNEITASASYTPTEKNGTAEVYFTCDTSKVDFTDKAIVLFEDLYYNKIHLAAHADITDEGQTLCYPSVSSVLAESESGKKNPYYSKDMKLTDTVMLSNMKDETVKNGGIKVTVKDVLYNKRTKKPVLCNGKELNASKEILVNTDTVNCTLDFAFDGTKTDLFNKADGTLADIVAFVYVYDENGNLIAKEEDLDNKAQTITLDIPKTTVTVNKVWDDAANTDGIRPESVKVQLYKDGDTKVGNAVTLSDDNNWSYTWKELPAWYNGEVITYTVKEENVPDDYRDTITEVKQNDTVEVLPAGEVSVKHFVYTVTNYHKPGTTNIKVRKKWLDAKDNDGIRPKSIKVQLYKDGDTKVGKAVTLSDDNDWSYTWEDLPKMKDGSEIVYTVDEVSIPDGYTKTMTKKGTVFTITNAHKTDSTEISVLKKWDDADDKDGIRPDSITVQLYKDGDTKVGSEVTLSEKNNWSYTWDNLSKLEDGKEISYTVDEVNVPEHYRKEVTKNGTAFTITNTHKPGTTNIHVLKVWNDEDNAEAIRPETIKVQLYKNQTEKVGKAVTLSEDNNWSYTWEDLDREENGTEIAYSVDEVSIPDGYTKEVTSEGTSFTITNSHDKAMTSVSVLKVWDDADNKDVIRPETIVVQLYADGKALGDTVLLSENNNWSYTWDHLPKMDAGSEITYTVDEISIPDGYTKTVTKDGTAFTITNTHKPGTTTVKVTKVWEDSNDKYQTRPKNITVQLYMGEGKGKKKVGDAITLDESMNWTYTWSNLEKLEDGKEIVYTVDEVKVPDGYKKTVTKDDQASITSYIITNTRPDKPRTPKTGDTFHMIPVFILFGMSLAAIIAILIKKRRK